MITLHQFQTARMERWIAERTADIVLRSPSIEEGEFERESSTYNSTISVGQIRLLPIWMCGPVPRCLVYATVLESLPDGRWKAAVFSPYGEPANQNEFRTSFAPENDPPDLALRTLCLWNSFPVPGELLAKSWIICDLPAEDLDAIDRIQSTSLSELDHSLRLRLGPPPEITAFALAELHAYMLEEESISDTILGHAQAPAKVASNVIFPCLWLEIVARETPPVEKAMVAHASSDFAVWVTDVPAKVFAKKAADPAYPTPLTLHKEATEFWKSKTPEISRHDNNRIDLIWKTHVKSGIEEGFPKTAYLLHSPMDNPPLAHPVIPATEVLLFDGSTSKLLGKGFSSPSGLQITLKSKKTPKGPMQIVLCKP